MVNQMMYLKLVLDVLNLQRLSYMRQKFLLCPVSMLVRSIQRHILPSKTMRQNTPNCVASWRNIITPYRNHICPIHAPKHGVRKLTDRARRAYTHMNALNSGIYSGF